MSTYFDKTDLDVVSGDDAKASDLNNFLNETDAAFEQVEQDITTVSQNAEKWSEGDLFVPVEPGKYSAKHYANIAEQWADGTPVDNAGTPTGDANAQDSALSAQTSAGEAADSASEALGYRNTALGYSQEAEAWAISETEVEPGEYSAKHHAIEAASSDSSATDSADWAYKWAVNPEDVEVEPGKYSALHYAAKALEASPVTSVTGVAEEVDVDNTDSKNPIVGLSSDFTGGVHRKNLLINGDFGIAENQRVFPFGTWMICDKWIWSNDQTETSTVTRQAAPSSREYPGRLLVNLVSSQFSAIRIMQPIETASFIAGKEVTYSFTTESAVAMQVSAQLNQRFDSGTPADDQTNLGVQKFNIPIGTTRHEYTFTVPAMPDGITEGQDTAIEFFFWLSADSYYEDETDSLGKQVGSYYIADVQLEIGPKATVFDRRLPKEELKLCQRYYWSGNAPGNGEGYKYGAGGASPMELNSLSFPVTMHHTPAIYVENGLYVNCSGVDTSENVDGLVSTCTVTATGAYRATDVDYSAFAEIGFNF